MQEKILSYTKSPVTVKTSEGTEQAQGFVFEDFPHLAVVMLGPGLFSVTHVKSGYQTSRFYERFSTAALELAQWAAITKVYNVDWDQEEPQQILSQIRDKPVPFDGSVAVSKDGRRPLTCYEWWHVKQIDRITGEFPWEEEHPLDKAEALMQEVFAPSNAPASTKPSD